MATDAEPSGRIAECPLATRTSSPRTNSAQLRRLDRRHVRLSRLSPATGQPLSGTSIAEYDSQSG